MHKYLYLFPRIGGEAVVSGSAEDIRAAGALILPGVGSFDHGIRKYQESGLAEVIHEKVHVDKIPILGICVGMQILFEGSEEGELSGLGWIPGRVVRFNFEGRSIIRPLKIPHMGWNAIVTKSSCKLFDGLQENSRFYFVHSYHPRPDCEEDVIATANYGYEFPCAFQRGNIYGVQFHPEKSHNFGMKLLSNFISLEKC